MHSSPATLAGVDHLIAIRVSIRASWAYFLVDRRRPPLEHVARLAPVIFLWRRHHQSVPSVLLVRFNLATHLQES
jgi:hypothetical protein